MTGGASQGPGGVLSVVGSRESRHAQAPLCLLPLPSIAPWWMVAGLATGWCSLCPPGLATWCVTCLWWRASGAGPQAHSVPVASRGPVASLAPKGLWPSRGWSMGGRLASLPRCPSSRWGSPPNLLGLVLAATFRLAATLSLALVAEAGHAGSHSGGCHVGLPALGPCVGREGSLGAWGAAWLCCSSPVTTTA